MMHVGISIALSTLVSWSLLAQLPPSPPTRPDPAAQAPPAPQDVGFGGLMVLPTHVLMEGRTHSAVVTLRNSGTAAASYRLLVKDMAMDQDGGLVERTKKPGELTAADLMFFSPKQVDLGPGDTQTVRIQVHIPDGLPEGEYRSHLFFEALPPPKPAEPLGDHPEKSLSINITMVLGVSIPVMVRHGTMTGKATLAGLRYLPPQDPDSPPVLAFRLERQGNCSVRGDLTASVESGGKLKPGTILYDLKNVVVYPETPFRNLAMPLWQNQDGSLKGARIKLAFQATELDLPGESAFLDLAP